MQILSQTYTMIRTVYLCSNIAKLYLLLFPVSLKVRYHLRCESLCDEKPFTTILPDQRQIPDDANESQCTLYINYYILTIFLFFFSFCIWASFKHLRKRRENLKFINSRWWTSYIWRFFFLLAFELLFKN